MKSYGQKMRLFALKEILERETDDQHGITMERILELLRMRDIKAERRSIYDDLQAFRESDTLDVTPPQGQYKEYAVVSRLFELPELKMIIDSIQSSKFLSEAKSRELIKKLETLCSKYEAQNLHRSVILANRVKNINSHMFYAVDAIHQAIAANKKIQYKYYSYDLDKQRKYNKKGGYYTASPYAMIYADDNYYLLAYESKKMKHFRVDKMDDVSVLAASDREGQEIFAKKNMADYNKYTFNMYGGEVKPVTMVFSNHLIGVVLDRFGRDVMIMKEDETHFRITVNVAESQQFFGWVFGLGKGVRIIGPDAVKEKMKQALADIAERYE